MHGLHGKVHPRDTTENRSHEGRGSFALLRDVAHPGSDSVRKTRYRPASRSVLEIRVDCVSSRR